jgi:hypothetical protein
MIPGFVLMLMLLFGGAANADDMPTALVTGTVSVPTNLRDIDGFVGVDDNQIITQDVEYIPTCASRIYEDALRQYANEYQPDDIETMAATWTRDAFHDPDVLRQVIQCPEFANAPADEMVAVPPIPFTLPDGRRIALAHNTTPEIIRHYIAIADKHLRDVPASAEITDANGDVWINTDPAWYGLMIVRAGSLDKYVAPGAANTISLDYIDKHIDEFMPENWHGGTFPSRIPMCTTGSALAANHDIINMAAHRTAADLGNDVSQNDDFYVSAGTNLQWIGWAQVAADIALTVATWGGGTVLRMAMQPARLNKKWGLAMRAMNIASRSDDVRGWRAAQAELKNLERLAETAQRTENLDDFRNTTHFVGDLGDEARNWTNMTDARNSMTRVLENQRDTIRRFEDMPNVKNYQRAGKDVANLNRLRASMGRLGRIQKTGNVWTRIVKTIQNQRAGLRALRQSGKVLSRVKSARIGRGSASFMSSAHRRALFRNTRDWTTDQMLRLGAVAGRTMMRGAGIYAGLKIIGDMWDFTQTATGEFTSNLDFKPLLLLNFDDLRGQENVVNHGMWLMWYGSGTLPQDDDAAFLQAMDFAEKFAEDIDDVQAEIAENPELRAAQTAKGLAMLDNLMFIHGTPGGLCDIDIYVVRPVIRNPGTDDDLYYLIMNDVPWRVRSDAEFNKNFPRAVAAADPKMAILDERPYLPPPPEPDDYQGIDWSVAPGIDDWEFDSENPDAFPEYEWPE